MAFLYPLSTPNVTFEKDDLCGEGISGKWVVWDEIGLINSVHDNEEEAKNALASYLNDINEIVERDCRLITRY